MNSKSACNNVLTLSDIEICDIIYYKACSIQIGICICITVKVLLLRLI